MNCGNNTGGIFTPATSKYYVHVPLTAPVTQLKTLSDLYAQRTSWHPHFRAMANGIPVFPVGFSDSESLQVVTEIVRQVTDAHPAFVSSHQHAEQVLAAFRGQQATLDRRIWNEIGLLSVDTTPRDTDLFTGFSSRAPSMSNNATPRTRRVRAHEPGPRLSVPPFDADYTTYSHRVLAGQRPYSYTSPRSPPRYLPYIDRRRGHHHHQLDGPKTPIYV